MMNFNLLNLARAPPPSYGLQLEECQDSMALKNVVCDFVRRIAGEVWRKDCPLPGLEVSPVLFTPRFEAAQSSVGFILHT